MTSNSWTAEIKYLIARNVEGRAPKPDVNPFTSVLSYRELPAEFREKLRSQPYWVQAPIYIAKGGPLLHCFRGKVTADGKHINWGNTDRRLDIFVPVTGEDRQRIASFFTPNAHVQFFMALKLRGLWAVGVADVC